MLGVLAKCTSLEVVTVCGSSKLRIGFGQGLTSCSALTRLEVSQHCAVIAHHAWNSYETADILPAAMAQLVQLTSLTGKQTRAFPHASQSFKVCYMHLEVTGPLAVKYDLARLSNLTMLSVTLRCSDIWCHYLFSPATEVQFNGKGCRACSA